MYTCPKCGSTNIQKYGRIHTFTMSLVLFLFVVLPLGIVVSPILILLGLIGFSAVIAFKKPIYHCNVCGKNSKASEVESPVPPSQKS
jgi:predicted nucleic acid-binding Zn ribbon protein